MASVPLGAALLDTSLEVRDARGRVITEGRGQLFIGRGGGHTTHPLTNHRERTPSCLPERCPPAGGRERVCLIDAEAALVPGTMRATGDWVRLDGDHLHYLGRRDRLVKRNGQRVNLDTVQHVRASVLPVQQNGLTSIYMLYSQFSTSINMQYSPAWYEY